MASSTACRSRRLAPLRLSVGLALALSVVSPVARAVTAPPGVTDPEGASTAADPTWGVWPTPEGRAPRVRALAVVGRTVYLGGDFTTMVPPGSKLPPVVTTSTTTLSTTTTTTTATTTASLPPAVSAMAAPLATAASTTTTRPGPPPGSQTRNHLAALDVDRHTLLPWDPDADGSVSAVAASADGTKLYVGGDFSHIGGQPASRLARIDLATGAVDPTFRAGVRGGVRALALAGDRLYVGGVFNYVEGAAGGAARPKVAALDAATGALLPWTPPAMGPGRYTGHNGTPTPSASGGDVLGLAVPADGSRVYVGGNFMSFGGMAGLVVFDAGSGQPLPQQWKTGRPIFDLTVSPADGTTVFASAGGSGGQVSAFNPDQPKGPVWATWVDGDAPGVAASATTVYLMGHYDYAGKASALRHHLAAFDAGSGAVGSWNPTANTPWGAFTAAVGADHVFVGGEFTRINGQPQPGFAEFDLPPPPPPTSTTTTTSMTTSPSSSSTTTMTHPTTPTTSK